MINRKIAVIGLGYVGLPVAVAFGARSHVIGFDVNQKRIQELKDGHDATNEIEQEKLVKADILYTSNADDLADADFYIIAVPTPITDAKHPNMKPLLSASKTVGAALKCNDIVVYESTVYPGATEEECIPVLDQQSELSSGEDFFVGYSPERINPGDKVHTFENIKKIVSGQTDEALEIIAEVYSSVITAGVHKAPSIKVAEAAKVIENTQRDVNIALMNQLAMIFDMLSIDSNDVIEAIRTKWNALPFTPGLVGGHCIGVDPYYLSYRAAKSGFMPDLILESRNINDGVGAFITSQLIRLLVENSTQINGAVISILGITFKENVPDIRNSKVMDIINELSKYNVTLQIHDSQADKDEVKDVLGIKLTPLEDMLPASAVVLAVPHQNYIDGGWDLMTSLLQGKGVVYDVKGVLPRDEMPENILLKRL